MGAPLLVDLKRGALDDGPGIRTVVFFKGCPLRCVFCQNPEAIYPGVELQRGGGCLGCRRCSAACPEQRARPAGEEERAGRCRLCGACVEACPSGARRRVGTPFEPEALCARLLRDQVFWRRSGGGVTLSGGEPTLHVEVAGELAARLRTHGVHVLLETCGHFAWEPFSRHLLPHLQTIFFDLKLADPDEHRRFTGRGNAPIHENLRRLARRGGVELVPRIPLVPGITDGEANLDALASLVREAQLTRVTLLPYNPLWLDKRRALGHELPYQHAALMSEADLLRCRGVMERHGLELC
jgi:pyruvate formate lyase activating enzyme